MHHDTKSTSMTKRALCVAASYIDAVDMTATELEAVTLMRLRLHHQVKYHVSQTETAVPDINIKS